MTIHTPRSLRNTRRRLARRVGRIEKADVREKPSAGLIRGTSFRYVDGKYFYTGNREPLPKDMRLVAPGMITCWQKWRARELVDVRPPDGGYHPSREQLPDDDETLWPIGQNGNPADPWADARYLYFVDPATAAEYTFLTSTTGGRIACSQLKAQIQTVRHAHVGAVPLVQLASTTFKTKHGPKPRPQFDVVEWRNTGGGPVPALVKPAPDWGKDLDDEIPF